VSRAGYDAIIFDLDGTLWNVNECCTDAWNIVLQDIGYDRRITLNEMNSVTGMPMDEIIRTLLPGINHNHEMLYDRFNSKEEELVGRQGTYLYPGMQEGITKLADHFRVYIVSNCQGWYLNRFLDFSGIKNLVSGCDCYGDSGVEKYHMIAGIKKKDNIKNAVYIGDTLFDRDSARKSCTDFIQVTYGFGKPIDGEKHFESFTDLSEYLMFSV
jgi:phosphoglycolate phosphatase